MKHLILFALMFCTLVGCGTQRQVTQLVERTSVDTVYLSNTQYDSIYIYKDRSSEYHRARPELIEGTPSNLSNPSNTDTLYIKDVSIEYRYKMLRDTIYKTQIDSIPYQVTVTEVKEITRPLTIFDRLCRICFFFLLGSLITWIAIKLRKVFKP